MEEQIPTQTIPVSQARQKLGEIVNEVYKRKVRIIVEKSGIPVAALVALADLERWDREDRRREEGGVVGPEPKDTTSVAGDPNSIQFPTTRQLARRQALVRRILKRAEERDIRPLNTTDLVHQARKEREEAFGRWSH